MPRHAGPRPWAPRKARIARGRGGRPTGVHGGGGAGSRRALRYAPVRNEPRARPPFGQGGLVHQRTGPDADSADARHHRRRAAGRAWSRSPSRPARTSCSARRDPALLGGALRSSRARPHDAPGADGRRGRRCAVVDRSQPRDPRGRTRVGRGVRGRASSRRSLVFVGDSIAVDRRQHELAGLMAATAGATSLSIFVGGGIAAVSWRAGFAGMAVLTLLLAGLLGRVAEPPGRAPSRPLEQLRRFFARPWALVVIAIALVEGIVVLGCLTYLAPAVQASGHGPAVAGLSVAVFGVGTLGASMFIKLLIGRVRSGMLMIIGGVNLATGWMVAAVDPGLAGAAVCSAFVGVGFAFLHSTLQTWATDVAPDARATTISFFAAALFVGPAPSPRCWSVPWRTPVTTPPCSPSRAASPCRWRSSRALSTGRATSVRAPPCRSGPETVPASSSSTTASWLKPGSTRWPPSTGNSMPVTFRASSDASQIIASAITCGGIAGRLRSRCQLRVATRYSSSVASARPKMNSTFAGLWPMCVWTTLGSTALTRMPCPPSSTRSCASARGRRASPRRSARARRGLAPVHRRGEDDAARPRSIMDGATARRSRTRRRG